VIINEALKVTGSFEFKLYDKNMNLKDSGEKKNLVVDVGKEWVAKYLAGESPDNLSFMALGSDGTAPDVADTGLGNELGRVALDSVVRTGASILYIATFLPTIATGSVIEAGLFNAAAGGEMLSRVIFTLATKDPSDAMVGVWNITVQ